MTLISICSVFAAFVSTARALGVVPISIEHTGRSKTPLHRRADTYAQTITNNISYGGYFTSISVGTPPQSQDVLLDTGSSDLWLLSSDASVCSGTGSTVGGPGSGPGFPTKRKAKRATSACISTYDSSSSSTYNNLSKEFGISYVDGNSATGYFFEDELRIGSATLDSVQMGLVNTSEIEYGIMGIGFTAGESTSTLYPNVIDEFYSQGLIGAKAYSLYLDDLASSTGTILFGGVDSDKYTGELISVPIIKRSSASDFTSFTVTLSSVTAVYGNGTMAQNYSSDAEAVILDSGTTLTYLPEEVADSIMNTFDATYVESLGYATCSCSLAQDSDLSLSFQFGGTNGPIISVGLGELVLQTGSSAGVRPGSGQGSSNNCAFGISKSSSTYLLGDTFLRSSYVVYDLDKGEIALAQSNTNSTSSSVTAMASGSSIPGVSRTATAVVASSTSSNGGSTAERSSGMKMTLPPCTALVAVAMLSSLLLT